MPTLAPGDRVPDLVTTDEVGAEVRVPAEDRWTHIWFNPVFGRYGCRECQRSLLHELYPEIRLAGCRPVAVTFDPVEVNQRRNDPHPWRIPIVQVSPEVADAWGALRDTDDPWRPHTPRSVAYLVDQRGHVFASYEQIDHTRHALQVLQDLKVSMTQECLS